MSDGLLGRFVRRLVGSIDNALDPRRELAAKRATAEALAGRHECRVGRFVVRTTQGHRESVESPGRDAWTFATPGVALRAQGVIAFLIDGADGLSATQTQAGVAGFLRALRTVPALAPNLAVAVDCAAAALGPSGLAGPPTPGVLTTPMAAIVVTRAGLEWAVRGDLPVYLCRRETVSRLNQDNRWRQKSFVLNSSLSPTPLQSGDDIVIGSRAADNAALARSLERGLRERAGSERDPCTAFLGDVSPVAPELTVLSFGITERGIRSMIPAR